MSTTDTLTVANVKIKKEKLDPEIERKLNPDILPDSTNPTDEEAQIDEKKNIEPVKSSNEILAELFKVFNATPPEELLSNDKLSKKAKKEHKKTKHKKSKKRKRKAAENSEASGNESHESETSSRHKRKKHKRKHKKAKEKSMTDDEDDEKTERTVIMAADSSSSSKVKKEPVDTHETVKVEKTSPSCSKSENRERVEKRLRNCTHVEECSDVTLSDEETYLRERNRYNEPANDESTKRTKYDRYRNVFYRNNNNSYYSNDRHDRGYYRHHHRSRTRTRSRSRSRTKTRSRSPPRDLGIDKKRLLEIARKNAITMFKSGSLPGCAGMSEEVKDKVLLKMRYGGKTVQDLTNFCKKLTKGENYDDLSEFSSEEDSDVDKQGNAKAFHHPFVLKDREPIVMHIKNATPIVPKTADQKKAITMQFPVSSGQQHRLTEGWVPVTTKEPETPVFASVAPKPVILKPLGVPKNVFQKQLPVEEQQPAFKPVGVNGAVVQNSEPEVAAPDPAPVAAPLPQPPIVPPPAIPVPVPVPVAAPAPAVPTIFPPPVDVSTIISQRLSAMRRLQENPMDSEAIKMMYTSQKEMTTWASSKHMPGQFTGSTGANILSAKELTSGNQAWARKDQLTSTVPVSGGMGMHLLKKMGWKPGEGLGREKTGSLQPLLLDVKLDKRGLVADEEVNGNRQQKAGPSSKRKKNNNNNSNNNNIAAQAAAKQALDSKHPVCLLNELSTKRKWTPPMYELVTDEGPSHNKFFVFSVNVNGQVFNPGTGGNTKKEAKLITAKYCLQQMGILS